MFDNPENVKKFPTCVAAGKIKICILWIWNILKMSFHCFRYQEAGSRAGHSSVSDQRSHERSHTASLSSGSWKHWWGREESQWIQRKDCGHQVEEQHWSYCIQMGLSGKKKFQKSSYFLFVLRLMRFWPKTLPKKLRREIIQDQWQRFSFGRQSVKTSTLCTIRSGNEE